MLAGRVRLPVTSEQRKPSESKRPLRAGAFAYRAVEEEKAEASFKNGVLTVTIPKSATPKDTAEHMAGSEGEAMHHSVWA